MGRITQDYTVRGELSASLGCESKSTSSYFCIVLASVSSVVGSLKEGCSVFKVSSSKARAAGC